MRLHSVFWWPLCVLIIHKILILTHFTLIQNITITDLFYIIFVEFCIFCCVILWDKITLNTCNVNCTLVRMISDKECLLESFGNFFSIDLFLILCTVKADHVNPTTTIACLMTSTPLSLPYRCYATFISSIWLTHMGPSYKGWI